jgi:CheY-like chemotaxis protein
MARILVIDDEPALRSVLGRVLRRAGHDLRDLVASTPPPRRSPPRPAIRRLTPHAADAATLVRPYSSVERLIGAPGKAGRPSSRSRRKAATTGAIA